MAASSFIAVDLGGQSGRVAVGTFDVNGFDLVEVHRFANVPVSVDGVLCWDVEALFDATLTGVTAAVTRILGEGSTVEGMAVDSWGVDYGLVDTNGSLVAPVRHYRANTQEYVDLANERVPELEAYQRTGIIGLSINTVYQLVRDAAQGLLDAGPTVLLTPDLWTFWLTGACAAEATIASTTGLVDRRTGLWATDLLERWGLSRAALPPLVSPGSSAGVTSPEVTARIGASAPVPVFHAPAHDTASAFAAVVSPGDRSGVISCGTWALVGCSAVAPVLSTEAMAAGFTNEVGAEDSALVIRNLSGTWLLDECIRHWAEADGIDDEASLRDRLLREASALPDSDVVIDPGAPELIARGAMAEHLADLHSRAGGQPGLSRGQTVRLIVDSLAASFADSVAMAGRLTGVPPERIHMIGGGSRIDLLVRLSERASGLPVVVGHPEATSVGSICVQAVASGLFPDLAAARQAVAAPGPTTMEAMSRDHT